MDALRGMAKTAYSWYGFWTSLGGLIVLLFTHFGIPSLAPNSLWDVHPFYISAVIIVVIVLISAKTLQRVMIEAERNFYETHPEARRDRAFRVFYDLYGEGRGLQSGTPEQWESWDIRMKKEISTHCFEDAMTIYLSRTGRFPEGDPDLPLREKENFERGLKWLDHLLHYDLDVRIQ